jgi:predicted TIM-barrel fold metal-dependent hydrolase
MTRRTLAAAFALAAAAALLPGSRALASSGAALPVFDAHIHYSHDAWEVVPTAGVISLMREAGLRRALVSSSDDEGTQRLLAAAPDLVVPSLRPYRRRGEISTWVRDESVARHVEERLARYRYAAIGEFHLYGADADLPVPRRIVELAREHGLVLHAHSDADAVERIFAQDPNARVLWAHAGFERPERVREMLRKHANLWADLAFRTDHASGGKPAPEWREAFMEFPDRFMVGTDTYVPERWHFVPEHSRWSREWLATLPRDVAENIAWRNGERVVRGWWRKLQAQ